MVLFRSSISLIPFLTMFWERKQWKAVCSVSQNRKYTRTFRSISIMSTKQYLFFLHWSINQRTIKSEAPSKSGFVQTCMQAHRNRNLGVVDYWYAFDYLTFIFFFPYRLCLLSVSVLQAAMLLFFQSKFRAFIWAACSRWFLLIED